MADPRPDPGKLVMTQAELPPGIDAPSPELVRAEAERQAKHRAAASASDSPADLVRQVRQLADRVGGIDRLRELLDEVAKLGREQE
jgi:hypothetical protein